MNEEIGSASKIAAIATLVISIKVVDSYCSKFNVNKQRTKENQRVRSVFGLIFRDNPFTHSIFLRFDQFKFQFDNRIVSLEETHLLLIYYTLQ